jgi:hypothetical protein
VTRAGRRIVALGWAVWAAAVGWLAAIGVAGVNLPAWVVAACSAASFGVGYAACGLLNHSP